ncbi:hypothetical protein [Streptomyces sp. A1136]|uniref:hypothetical protein n=1 Tax=Streptomyces sp. A1136 TaxID=2563102 RepID=UPI00109E6BC4|nr:hypothetical protein [Streptomyces sp. A1136]THA47103.1 hypothetical protein E6R62_32105 [Streptomyces sp. A1136]
MSLWDVLPDNERQQWVLDPFVSVGPLRFGMSSGETSVALGGIRADVRQHDPQWGTACHTYPDVGVKLYFAADECLCGVSVDALRGPQVLADGAAVVGQVPSELEQWLFERAESREPFTELFYMPRAEAGSLTLGVVLCVQRAADSLRTRPVFLPADVLDDPYHRLPSEAWAIF